ncbi:hypothetical protein CsSME_00035835 [Camellia sinensis var. sinensis]
MTRGGETMCTRSRTSREHEKCQFPHRRNRSPRREKQQRGSSPQPRPRGETSATLRPLSSTVFVGNKPMIEADSIMHDPNVAVEFARQIFPPEVQQSMVGRPDFKVFREGVHGAAFKLANRHFHEGLVEDKQSPSTKEKCIPYSS